MEFLTSFKNYFVERPELAFLALSLLAVLHLYRKNQQLQDERVKILERVLPLTLTLSRLIARIKKVKENDNS